MRPGFVLVSLTPIFGGGEIYCERLCRLLENDFEIRAIVASEELAKRLRAANVAAQLLPRNPAPLRLRQAARAIGDTVRATGVQAVLLNGQAEANLVPFCRRAGMRTLVIRHTDLRLHSGALKRALYRRNAARADGVICVSRHLADRHSFVAAERVHVVPHWVAVRPVQSVLHEKFTVLYIGRLEPAKGVQELAAAAQRLPEVEFLVAGDGELRSSLASGAPKLRLLGFQPDISGLLAQADLLVHPSHSEGSSLVALEAMAAGVPCLLSDIPVLREISKDGATAALFPCGDSDALAQSILQLRAAPEKRAQLAAAARVMVSTEHSPANARERYGELLG